MELNSLEFFLMNNPIRAYIQEKYELPILMSMLSKDRFNSVLEIGCGNGTGTKLIKKYFNPLKITAVDLDEKMIQIAKKKENDASITFMQMDASRLNFPDRSFDAVFNFGIIHHIPNWQACIAELKRVLKDGGELIMEDLSIDTFSGFPGFLWRSLLAHPYDHMFTTDELIQQLKDAGFTIRHFKKYNPLFLIRHFSLTAASS